MVETAVVSMTTDIKDIAFLGDCSLLVLQRNKGMQKIYQNAKLTPNEITEEKSSMLSIPCQVEDSILSYHSSTASGTSASPHDIIEILPHCKEYYFPEAKLFIPDSFKLSESSIGRQRRNATRICVLDKTRLRYKFFKVPDLPFQQLNAEEDISMS